MLREYEVKAVVLYGSHARGNADQDSDIDVCVFATEGTKTTEKQVRELTPSLPGGNVNVTTYSERDLNSMIEYGSLFLWHLRLEGSILYGEDYLALQLKRLEPFQRHHAEIAYYQDLLGDLISAADIATVPNEFDLSLLFTIARNSCMILTHKAEVPVFGRSECYQTAARLYADLPLASETYSFLSKWKLVYERGLDFHCPLPSPEEMRQLIGQVQQLVEYAYEKTN